MSEFYKSLSQSKLVCKYYVVFVPKGAELSKLCKYCRLVSALLRYVEVGRRGSAVYVASAKRFRYVCSATQLKEGQHAPKCEYS